MKDPLYGSLRGMHKGDSSFLSRCWWVIRLSNKKFGYDLLSCISVTWVLFCEVRLYFFDTKNIPQQLVFVLHKRVDRLKFLRDFFLYLRRLYFMTFLLLYPLFCLPDTDLTYIFIFGRFTLFMKRLGFLPIPFCTDRTTDLDSEKIGFIKLVLEMFFSDKSITRFSEM